MKRFLLLALVTALMPLSACQHGTSRAQKDKERRAPLVTVAPVKAGAVPIQLKAVGNVEAFSTVAIRAQVGGELKRIHFKQGQDVHQGDPLFTIDPRLPLAAVRQAEAALARDTAHFKHARAQFRRYEALFKEGGVSREQFDQIQANLAAIEATLESDRAAVENARTQLSFVTIQSPVSGRTGSFLLNEGNLVKANDASPLVVINQIQPIYVTFSLPQQDLSRIKQGLSVEASAHGDNNKSVGTLSFVDNAIDGTTGTVRLKGTFENREKRLWPGQFVDVAVTLGRLNALLIPSQATQIGQQGKFVYVLKPDDTVEARMITVAQSDGGSDVVTEGLTAGEKVVTDGQMQLTPGAKVRLADRRKR